MPAIPNLDANLILARDHLAKGKCIVLPTETVYGLAARIDQSAGIEAIFTIKKRPSFDPLIVHVAAIEQVHDLAHDWSLIADSLARKFWPGPLTLVVKKNAAVNPLITAGLDTVGIRMPRHPLALTLIKAAGAPLAAPSANRFGKTSPTTLAHVQEEFREEISSGEILAFDGGPCEVGVESTVCLVQDSHVSVLRPGGITIHQLREHFLNSVGMKHITVGLALGHQASPGHTEHHYETEKPLIVSWTESLRPTASYTVEGKIIPGHRIQEIVLPLNPALAARELYSALRAADRDATSDALFIYRGPHTHGLWMAIDDRLMRAARLRLGAPSEVGD